ncbi:MAG TPA: 30S ribosome-binding factor RbfA [Candidatus Atribacteria bacterium]|nr:30S ribosome-binding factor RbfA [Candidatus Atribacteria bacterium]HPT79039.1 30S ribosome-binding factor RbfA [Candidatus Atribacteria bacterium]
MARHRIDRINEEIRKDVIEIIRDLVKDPRISEMSTVTKVETTKDLRYAKVYVSVLGSEEERLNTIEGLKSAAGFIRKELGSRLEVRYIPELQFVLDNSIAYSVEISRKLNELRLEQEKQDDD